MVVLIERHHGGLSGGVAVEKFLTRSFSCVSACCVSSFYLHIQIGNAGSCAESGRRGETKRMKDKRPKRTSVKQYLRWVAVLQATFIDKVDGLDWFTDSDGAEGTFCDVL